MAVKRSLNSKSLCVNTCSCSTIEPRGRTDNSSQITFCLQKLKATKGVMKAYADFLLVSVPHRNGGLSGSHSSTAGDEVRACLQTLRCELQTHEAELDLAARADDVLAACFVVLHPLAAGGTGADGGTGIDPLHLREGGGLAGLEELEVEVDAAVVVTAVGAWSWTLPRLQTLPAELVRFLLVSCADGALHVEVRWVFSLQISFTARALWDKNLGTNSVRLVYLFSHMAVEKINNRVESRGLTKRT